MEKSFQRSNLTQRSPPVMSQQSTTARQCGICLEDIPGGTERVKCSQCQARIHKLCFDNANPDPSIKSCPVCKSTPSEKEDTPCYYCGVKFKKSNLVKATGSNKQAYLLCPPCMTQAQKDMEDEEEATRIRLEERAVEEAKRERLAQKAAEQAKREQLAQKAAKEQAKRERLAQKAAEEERERLAQKAAEEERERLAQEAAEKERQAQKAQEEEMSKQKLQDEQLALVNLVDTLDGESSETPKEKDAKGKKALDIITAGPSNVSLPKKKTSSVSSKTKREAIDKKIEEISKETMALTKLLADSKKAVSELMEMRSEINTDETDSSEEDSMQRTSAWAQKATPPKRKEPKVKFSVGTTDAESSDQDDAYETFKSKSKRASSPMPYLKAKTHAEFINTLKHNNCSTLERSISRERTLGQNTSRLTLDQSIARQGVTQSLPTFSGNPMEWPDFIHDYVTSTIRCNFSDVENSRRLKDALKGDALRLVKTKLMFPEKINEAIAMLRLKFGRPDQILDSLVEKVKNIQDVGTDDLNGIVELTIAVDDIISILKASAMEEDLKNAKLLRDFVKKLPPVYRVQWGFQRNTTSNIEKFYEWLLELAYVAAEMADADKPKSKKASEKQLERSHPRRTPQETRRVYHADVSSPVKAQKETCVICSRENHKAHECFEFIRQEGTERWQTIRRLNLCGKCLGGHDFRRCRKRVVCGVKGCPGKHHPLLHQGYEQLKSASEPTPRKNAETPSSSKNAEKPSSSKESGEKKPHLVGTHHTSSPTKFRILPVRLYNDGMEKMVYAFLDEGSSVTLIDEELADELNLKGPKSKLCLQWTNDVVREEDESREVEFEVSNLNRDKRYRMKEVRTVKNISLPTQSITTNETKRFDDIPIARYREAQPKLLIGLSHWSLAQTRDYCEDRDANLIAVKCHLGWTIVGNTKQIVQRVNVHDCICKEDIDQVLVQLKKFFSTEYFGVRATTMPIQSDDNKRAEATLNRTIQFKDGRYEVGLLWKRDNVTLPDSYTMAMQRLKCFNKKLRQDEQMRANINAQIMEYEAKGYIEEMKEEDARQRTRTTWYLPLFAVVNPHKPGKIRMVWDAAAKSKNISLNSELLSGPDLVSPLVDVLRRFRQFQFAITADIREMFHRVLVREQDQDSQRFLFQSSDDQPIKTYRMRVMTFGATCSPFSAQYVKNHNAHKYRKEYPAAVNEIKRNHYVDDFASSFKTEKEAVRTTKQVVEIHGHGGFELRGFASNLATIPSEFGEATNPETKHLTDEESQTKVLGLYWRTADDTLNFEVNTNRIGDKYFSAEHHPSKREVLKVMMSIYDPLGLIAPFLIQVKAIMQEVWKSGVNWDDKINNEEARKWHQWLMQLKHLNISIPRCYGIELSAQEEPKAELHIFVDASQQAFAAVAYFRMPSQHGKFKCSLIGAKSKVAPLKPMSIPRLELQAAVLGTRFATSIENGHTIKVKRRFFWSDSMNVLGWLRSEARKYKTFVALRIGEILENSNPGEWRYVPTEINIADDATKTKPNTFSEDSRWFVGPKFLELPEADWPTFHKDAPTPLEEAKIVQIHRVSIPGNASPNVERVSKWEILVRAQVWVLRVLRYQKRPQKFQRTSFTKEELEEAEKEIWRTTQAAYYDKEINILKEGMDIPQTSDIYSLTPFLDEDGLIRMRGRLRYAKIPEDAKHPIILPSKHRTTRLLIQSYHRKYLHENNETIVNQLRQQYWIIKMRATVRAACRDCRHCQNQRAKPAAPMMADLPKDRVTSSTPFAFVGLDYFGPLEVVNHRRREKRWVALFTCLSVRAVHLEIVNTLTSGSAIMALRRFCSKRGVPLRLWSDNATTFKGAKRELDEQINFHEVAKEADGQIDKFDWVFIPPAAPHMGGAWERLVQSIKKALSRIQPMRLPTQEQLSTYLAEVTNIVNSRPLTYMPMEVGTIEALTPNHFLLRNSKGSKSLGKIAPDGDALRKMWKQTQLQLDEFWRRWTTEFISTLNKRPKWYNETKPLKIGDIGMLYDDDRRNSWRLGRVVEVKRAQDGQIREVLVKTANGLYRRPATRFAALEVSDGDHNAVTPGESPPESFTKGGIVKTAKDNSKKRRKSEGRM